MNVCAKPEPARCAEEEQSALALASRLLEHLARLPEVDHAAYFFLRFGLPAHVLELHAPLCIARLVAPDLGDAHPHDRPEQDQEVEDEVEEEQEEERRVLAGLGALLRDPVEEGGDGAPPGDARVSLGELDEVPQRDAAAQASDEAVEEPPRPRAPPVDDVFLAQPPFLRAEEARPGNEPADDQIDQAAEPDHGGAGREERLAHTETDFLVEEEIRGRACQERDDRGDARQAAQLAGERNSLLARP